MRGLRSPRGHGSTSVTEGPDRIPSPGTAGGAFGLPAPRAGRPGCGLTATCRTRAPDGHGRSGSRASPGNALTPWIVSRDGRDRSGSGADSPSTCRTRAADGHGRSGSGTVSQQRPGAVSRDGRGRSGSGTDSPRRAGPVPRTAMAGPAQRRSPSDALERCLVTAVAGPARGQTHRDVPDPCPGRPWPVPLRDGLPATPWTVTAVAGRAGPTRPGPASVLPGRWSPRPSPGRTPGRPRRPSPRRPHRPPP